MSPPHLRPQGKLLVLLSLAVLYLGLGLLSFRASVTDGIVTPTCFYPEGLALAAGIALGPWVWPGIFLGQLLLAGVQGLAAPAALAIACFNSVEAVAGCLLFEQLGLRSDLRRLRDLSGLLLLIFGVLQPFSASLGTFTLWMSGVLPDQAAVLNTWLSWWTGNSLGQALLTPLLLSAVQQRQQLARFLGHALLAALVITPTAWLAFQLIGPERTSVLLVLFTPLLVLLAVGLGLPGATVGGLSLTITSQWMTVHGQGPFVDGSGIRIMDLNIFVLGLSLTAEFLAVLLSERRLLEQQLRHYAFFDTLTQLPNRRFFQDRLSQAQRSSSRSGDWAALILLDLDRFKPLNDNHGHEAGDRLLVEVARRLQGCLSPEDLAARLGGDEFAVILEQLGPDERHAVRRARAVAESIALSLQDRFDLGGIEHRCSASYGIRLFHGAGQDSSQLLRDADVAMYASKKRLDDPG